MTHTLEASPLFQPVAWMIVISSALFVGSLTWNAYHQIQEITERTLTLEAELLLNNTEAR
ncbi:hypothetical protein A2392_03160 [Candidatus Kaiserbacteria bacterium RIFOXYB1_FULL_46_14]|uniref:Uncharacterized protein n=1 Tax=Candidatus Kaiserbacteria bacterium RIFOXYB1_FULL_46_14 TaxID=1798531 RepID=A0A1F6FJD3_9BACT|nr:MAG: hypothetical protein A2392_03160 [Candidatus Kaiserbacteria bacterium RIFOXYB1_FULL_46_14]